MHCVSDWMRPVNCYKGLYFCNAVFPAPWDFQVQYLVWPLGKKNRCASIFGSIVSSSSSTFIGPGRFVLFCFVWFGFHMHWGDDGGPDGSPCWRAEVLGSDFAVKLPPLGVSGGLSPVISLWIHKTWNTEAWNHRRGRMTSFTLLVFAANCSCLDFVVASCN